MTESNFSRDKTTNQRLSAAIAGHQGDSDLLKKLLSSEDNTVRASSYRGLDRLNQLTSEQLERGLLDSSAAVRRTCAELAAGYPTTDLIALLGDDDDYVVEVAAWSIGEHEIVTVDRIAALIELSSSHENPQCREQAVASLGAIGHESGLAAILAATKDKATVRRRAIIALAPFEGEAVDGALKAALEDRDWQVRQAAEDQLDISS